MKRAYNLTEILWLKTMEQNLLFYFNRNNYFKLFQIIIFVFFLFSSKLTVSQDFHLSMPEESSILINPANTGVYDGMYRFHLQHKSQWGSIMTKPFLTETFTAERNFKPFGAGMLILNNRAGVGSFNQFSFYGSGSYEISVDPNKQNHLFCGVQIGLVQNSINVSNLTFDNQYTMSGGGGFDPSLSSGESFAKTSVMVPDVNFGVYYINLKKRNYFSSFVYKTSEFTPYGGVTYYHLLQPKMTFYNYKNVLYRRFLAFGGLRYKITSDIGVDPYILWENQAKNNDITFGTKGYYYYGHFGIYGILGLQYRLKDSFILSMGGIYKQYTFRFAYDINVSKMNKFSRGKGGFEFSITFTMLEEGSYSLL